MPTDEDYTEAMRYPVSSMPHSLRSEIGQDLNHMNYTSNTRHCFIIAERILGMTASEIQVLIWGQLPEYIGTFSYMYLSLYFVLELEKCS